jgi:hypothetical protein
LDCKGDDCPVGGVGDESYVQDFSARTDVPCCFFLRLDNTRWESGFIGVFLVVWGEVIVWWNGKVGVVVTVSRSVWWWCFVRFWPLQALEFEFVFLLFCTKSGSQPREWCFRMIPNASDSVRQLAQGGEGGFDVEATDYKGDQHTGDHEWPWCGEIRGWVVRGKVGGMREVDVAMNQSLCNVGHDDLWDVKRSSSSFKGLKRSVR